MTLDRNPNLQVLWELKSKVPLDAQIAAILHTSFDPDAVRITPWLTADPSAIV